MPFADGIAAPIAGHQYGASVGPFVAGREKRLSDAAYAIL
jgi:hypothetical protein